MVAVNTVNTSQWYVYLSLTTVACQSMGCSWVPSGVPLSVVPSVWFLLFWLISSFAVDDHPNINRLVDCLGCCLRPVLDVELDVS